MLGMRIRKSISVLIVLNLTVILVYGSVFFWNHRTESAKQLELNTMVAKRYEAGGVFREEDFSKLKMLEEQVQRTQRLTDAQVDWILELRKRPIDPSKPYASASALTRPLPPLLDAHLTPSQEDKVFQAIVPLFTTPESYTSEGERNWACNAVRATKDKRGIPYLLPLLNYPDEFIQKKARLTLSELGYSTK